MKRILFLIIILFLFSGIALGTELGAGDGTGYPAVIDTDTSVEVDYPDPLATTARAAVPNDTNAAVIAIEMELGINPSGEYDTLKARLDAGDGLYYLKTEIDTKFAELKFTDLDDTPANYTDQAGKYVKVNAEENALEFGTPAGGGTYLELADTPAAYDNGKYAKSTADGVVWDDPAGAGDMLKTTYDTDIDNIVDKSETVDDGIGNSSTAADVKDAVTKKHSQNTDTDLNATFEATFVKKTDTVNVLSDITSAGADIEDAVTKKHTQNTDTQFDFYNALAEDHTWSGDKDTQLVGEVVAFGDSLYFDWATKRYKKSDADSAATMPGERIALESKTDGQTCLMLVKGYIRDDSAFEFTASMVYASCTPGAMSSTAPTETGDQIQRVGTAKSADILFFDPSIDVGEI